LGGYSVADHIDYVTDNFGIETAAIGSDFDGINDSVVSGPKDIVTLKQELRKRGYTPRDIDKIFYKNFLRIFRKSGKRNA
jgi:membrane dipeptidase